MSLRLAALLLVPLLSCSAAVSRDAQALIDQARGLPPEFAADLLLRVAASPAANDPKWKRGIIEDAFLLARSAPVTYPRLGDRAPSRHLEALSLQTRAVDAMLPVDPARALTLFRDIPTPRLPTVSCQEAVTPDLSPYYQTALAVFARGFPPDPHARQADVAFLSDLVSAIESPSQVVPALKLLDLAELNAPARSNLVATFLAALARVNGGDREFAASEPLLMGAAVPEMHEPGFLAALRAYIVRHIGGPRCSDQIRPGQLPESAAQFNKLISRVNVEIRVPPIGDVEAASLRDDGTYPVRRTASALPGDTIGAIENSVPDAAESSAEYSWRVANRYAALRTRAAILPALHFLERQYDSLDDRTLWSQEFWLLLLDTHDGRDDSWKLEQMAHSRNPVIAAYAAMERLPASR